MRRLVPYASALVLFGAACFQGRARADDAPAEGAAESPARPATSEAPSTRPPSPPGPSTGLGDARPSASRFFRVYDKDGDGRVSPAEVGTDPEIFRLLDADGDGWITPSDLGAARRAAHPPAGAKDKPPEAGADTPAAARGRRDWRALAERLKAMDADGDGRISREEYDGDVPFERLDQNGDGFLDGQDRRGSREGGRRGPRDPEALFRRFDKNGDGKLAGEELPRPGMLQRLDTDGDGAVGKEEFTKAMARFRREAGARGRPTPQSFRRFDTNRDGQVTRDEFPGPDERFRALDANGDGVLTDADRQAGDDAEAVAASDIPTIRKRDDVDGDGRVSRREFQGNDERFDALDRNQDGFLDDQDTPSPVEEDRDPD